MCNLVCLAICLTTCEPAIKLQLYSTPEGRDLIFRYVERDFLRHEKMHAEFQTLMTQLKDHSEQGRLLGDAIVRLSYEPATEKRRKQAAEYSLQMQQHMERGKVIDKAWIEFGVRYGLPMDGKAGAVKKR